ncbi:phosphotransferase [Virgibacillus sp. C22-A2]|uniref:Phosphotransferase n=1 Tax=Virgibacillus tibetensis TaxID=3042313 RepID=A0ABU6KKS4_9BACI|nr:phosphotransferase [Virgibacillus sp. C22-A2]
MNGIEVLSRFGFHTDEEPVSIYPFSPVYRVARKSEDLIIKKTQGPIERAQRLMRYTSNLKENGINVVTPVQLNKENPQTMGDDTYVVYPFIKGTVYTGEANEIYLAGKLLGKIHSLSPKENVYQLEEYDVYDFSLDEVVESMKNIGKNAADNNFYIERMQLKQKLIHIISQQKDLKESGLPNVMTPHDYKANNLIYMPEPYLVDPDNALWIPRIFDLALALLLFHNELDEAPDTIFTPKQWQTFLSGYKEFVELTEIEHAYWKKAIEHIFLDEVMWLMDEYEEDWAKPAQRELFHSLIGLLLDTSYYRLD